MTTKFQKVLDEIIASTASGSNSIFMPDEVAKLPFGEGLWPWINIARRRLNQRTTKKQRQLLSESAWFTLEKSLVEKWSKCAALSMNLEMGIARLQDQLYGETPEVRYRSFIKQKLFSAKNLESFFQEYSLCGKFIATFLLQWISLVKEFLSHLESDLPKLGQHFSQGKRLGVVNKIETNLSDPHLGGKTVFCVTFESGLCLFYKPKDLRIVGTFNAFIEELNQLGLSPKLKTYASLDGNNYCWEQKVEHLPCKNKAEISRFYVRSGMLLCLAYLFQSYDIHHENFIASGEFPFLIDLETIFCTELHTSEFEKAAKLQLYHSVFSTAMLPQYVFGEPGKPGIDISALTADDTQTKQRKRSIWKNINTDEMHHDFIASAEIDDGEHEENYLAQHTQKTGPLNKHRAKFNGELVSALDYGDEIVNGFETMYFFMIKHQKHLLESGRSLSKLANLPTRIVLRFTALYSKLSYHLFDPHVCLDSKKVEEVLEPLSRYPIHPNTRINTRIINAEKRALLQGDIPCFHTLPIKQDLFIQNRLIAKDALKEISYDAVINRLKTMNSNDCDLQKLFIQQSFQGYKFSNTQRIHTAEPVENSTEEKFTSILYAKQIHHEFPLITKDELLKHVETIAYDLKRQAFQDKDGELGWIALDPLPSVGQFAFRVITENLYSGRSGIALFFSALFHVTGKDIWKNEALNTLKGLRQTLHGVNKKRLIPANGIGGISGIGGILYALIHIGQLLNDFSVLDDAKILFSCLEERHIQEDNVFDVVGGSAGLLLALLTLHQNVKKVEGTKNDIKTEILRFAKICGDHLCKESKELGKDTIAWKKPYGNNESPLLGFSHGVAGISHALMRLAHLTQEHHYLEYALRALNYERKNFSLQDGNWGDFRNPMTNYNTIQWCHGATGIGLARLASLPFHNEPAMNREIEIALNTTKLNVMIDDRHHLCCGTFGRMSFLHEASKKMKDQERDLNELIWKSLTLYLIKQKDLQGKLKLQNSYDNFYKPGFFQGTAGIGYAMLQLIDPSHQLPQVLVME